jgi:hypothetical protein
MLPSPVEITLADVQEAMSRYPVVSDKVTIVALERRVMELSAPLPEIVPADETVMDSKEA